MVSKVAEAFFWGSGGRKLTPEQLAAEQEEVRKKKGKYDTSPVGHWTQGAARVVESLGNVLQERRLMNQQNALLGDSQNRMASWFSPVAEALTTQPEAVVEQPIAAPVAPVVAEELPALGSPLRSESTVDAINSAPVVDATAPLSKQPDIVGEVLEAGKAGSPVAEALIAKNPSSNEWLVYRNKGKTRDKPISEQLVRAMSFLPELGIRMEVHSGGQDAKGKGSRRTGSTRHDHGNAADVDFYTADGRKLDWNNQSDIPVLSDIVARAKANGVTGFGAGNDYMGAGRMHIGFGNPGVWGAKGKSENSPSWLVSAFNGKPPSNSQTVASAPTPQNVPTPTPSPVQANMGGLGNVNMQAVIQSMTNPFATPQERAGAQMLYEQQMRLQQQAAERQYQRDQYLWQKDQERQDPMYQANLAKINREAATGGETFFGNPIAMQDANGNIQYGQMGNKGTFRPISLPEGMSVAPPTKTVDTGTETILMDQAGNVITRTPKQLREAAAETAAGKVEGDFAANQAVEAQGNMDAALDALGILDQIESHPGLKWGTGITSRANVIPGTDQYDFQNLVEQAKSGAFLTAIQQMKGLGALSNAEGAAATAAVTRMDTATSTEGFLKALNDYRGIVKRAYERAKNRLPAEKQQQSQTVRRRFNPETGRIE